MYPRHNTARFSRHLHLRTASPRLASRTGPALLASVLASPSVSCTFHPPFFNGRAPQNLRFVSQSVNYKSPAQHDASETSLDIFQQSFCFAMLADLVNDKQATLKELQQEFRTLLTPYIQKTDGWRLAWGPTVWKLKPYESTYPANAGYVVYHPRAKFEDGSVHPTYLIAIAGTPLSSDQVLQKEDEAVDTVVDFNAWVAGGIQKEPVYISSKDVSHGIPYFSKGMAWGTYNLLNAVSSGDTVTPKKTLVQFLRSLSHSPSTRFIVAGHSLGGTLTTTVGLALVRAGVLHPGNTLTYPIAGSTAGNVDWSQQFTQNFPVRKLSGARGYQGWNHNLVNNLDCVPQLWCQYKNTSPQQWLGRIPAIYGTPAMDDVKKYVTVYAVSALKSGIVYKPVQAQYFDPPAPTTVPANLSTYFKEVLNQHAMSYLNEVGVTADQCGLKLGPQSGTPSDVTASKFPVAGALQQVISNPEEIQKQYDSIKDTTDAQTFCAQLA